MARKEKFELTPEIPQRLKKREKRKKEGGQGGIIIKRSKAHASYAIPSFIRL